MNNDILKLQKNFFLDSKVLITGHTGFKGSWLSLWLSRLGADITGVSIDVPTKPSHFEAAKMSSMAHDHRIDIRDGAALKALVAKIQPDYVFHLAAQPIVKRSYINPIETWHTNTIGTVNMLEALRELRTPCAVVLVTSDKCYNNVECVWGYRETDALGGPDPYSASKAAAELAIKSYIQSYFPSDGLVRIGIGRAGNVIGGGDWAEDRIVPDCVKAWSCGEVVQLRNPQSTRPWQHVLEPLGGYINLATALTVNPNLHGEPFNFGPPSKLNHSVGELADSMAKYWDRVRWVDISRQYDGPYESSLLKLNCDKALHYLQWRAIWGFEETVRETALWYRQFYEEPQSSIADFSFNQIISYASKAREEGLMWPA
jgi:CDP-glucose 4,6-dehydratase